MGRNRASNRRADWLLRPLGRFGLDSRAAIRSLRTTSPWANCGRASSLRYSGRPPPGRTNLAPFTHYLAMLLLFVVVAGKAGKHDAAQVEVAIKRRGCGKLRGRTASIGV